MPNNNGGLVAFPGAPNAAEYGVEGISKRELFAAMAMQGLACDGVTQAKDIPKLAVHLADELCAELAKK